MCLLIVCKKYTVPLCTLEMLYRFGLLCIFDSVMSRLKTIGLIYEYKTFKNVFVKNFQVFLLFIKR